MFVNLTDQQTDALRTLIDLELGASESSLIDAWRELETLSEQFDSGEQMPIHIVLQRHVEDDIAIEVERVVGPFLSCDEATAWIANQTKDGAIEYEANAVEAPAANAAAPAATEHRTIHVLHISHKHGDSFWTYDSKEDARARLARWVREWWDQEGVPGDPPDDDELAIGTYFEDVSGRESYCISGTTLNAG